MLFDHWDRQPKEIHMCFQLIIILFTEIFTLYAKRTQLVDTVENHSLYVLCTIKGDIIQLYHCYIEPHCYNNYIYLIYIHSYMYYC